tara:strand:+ start:1505 stop:4318 length:2814 start_codon:yes stop_codon:yes gene_type:complete
MAPVSLGLERDPSAQGTKGLLEIAVGGETGFKMVVFDFYKERLEAFQKTLQREAGSMSWVIGGRGTGKSEVLAHLFRVSVETEPSNPRLPIYISITDKTAREEYQDFRVQTGKGRDENLDDGSVTMGLFNYLCSRSMLEALKYLHSMDDASNTLHGFSLLRKCLEEEEFYNSLTSEFGVLNNPNFSLNQFMEILQKNPMTKEAFRLAIICDDFDKLGPEAGLNFFSASQKDFQTLTGTYRVVLVTSVTKEFVKAGKTEPGMNYCMGQTESERKVELGELWVPDISELTSKEIQNFIDHRIRHLHWDGVEWGFKPDKEPHKSVDDVIDNELWKSYDTTKMRFNGSLLELNAWLSGRGEVSMRQIISCLNTVLSSKDIEPKIELTPKLLDSALLSNNQEEIQEINKELHRRILKAGVSTEQLEKEELWLEEAQKIRESGESNIWGDLCTLVLDKVGLGKWKIPKRAKKHGIQRITENFSKKSGIFHFLNLVSELVGDPNVLPKVVSRTPDEIFAKFDERMLQVELNNIGAETRGREKGASKDKSSLEVDVEKPKKVDGGIIREAYRDALSDCDLDYEQLENLGEDVRIVFGHSMAYWIARWFIGPGKWQNAKRKVKKSFDTEPRIFANTLLQWFAMVIDEEGDWELDILVALNEVIKGEDPLALANLLMSGNYDSDPLHIFSGALPDSERYYFPGVNMVMRKVCDDILQNTDRFLVSAKIADVPWKGLAKVLESLDNKGTVTMDITLTQRPEIGALEQDMIGLTKWIDRIDSELSKLQGAIGLGKYFDDWIVEEIDLEYGLQLENLSKIDWDVNFTMNVEFRTDRTSVWIALANGRDHRGRMAPWINFEKTDWSHKHKFRVDGLISRTHGPKFKKLYFLFKEPDVSQKDVKMPWRMEIKSEVGDKDAEDSRNWQKWVQVEDELGRKEQVAAEWERDFDG